MSYPQYGLEVIKMTANKTRRKNTKILKLCAFQKHYLRRERDVVLNFTNTSISVTATIILRI